MKASSRLGRKVTSYLYARVFLSKDAVDVAKSTSCHSQSRLSGDPLRAVRLATSDQRDMVTVIAHLGITTADQVAGVDLHAVCRAVSVKAVAA
jgi:hypothetical protein